jgi:predicted dehydrogenase
VEVCSPQRSAYNMNPDHRRQAFLPERSTLYVILRGPPSSQLTSILQPAIQAAETLTLKAVYSRSLKSAKSLAEDASSVDLYSDDSGAGKSLDDLLGRSDIQAVTIALPIPNQPEYVRKALLAGKHVLSEKPIAENMKDAVELLQWYRKEIDSDKVFWGVAENYRFLNSFNQAAERRKEMGRILGFKVEQYSMLEGGKYYETG